MYYVPRQKESYFKVYIEGKGQKNVYLQKNETEKNVYFAT